MEAKRCPFCGKVSDLHMNIRYNQATDGYMHAVYCGSCDALGPVAKSASWAVRKWNKRIVAKRWWRVRRSRHSR